MSIIHTLKKIVDPMRAREEEMARKAQAEYHEDQRATAPPPSTFRCRVCEHEGDEPSYCPHCLADTMERVKRD